MPIDAKPDVYTRLALLWTDAVWGWLDHMPSSGALQKILRSSLNEEEAEALCEFPLGPIPLEFVSFDEIAAKSSFPRDRLEEIFDGLVERGLLYFKKMEDGSKAYSILRGTYGYSQTFFWKGEINPQAREIAKLVLDPDVMKAQMDFFTTVDTKAYRYIPTTEAIDPNWQNVYPSETIEKVINSAYKIALAHCPCRIRYELINGKGCGHPTDVCLKINELAECVIEAGLAKEISHEEALQVIKKSVDEGLVHFADNTGEGIKHI